MSSRITRLYTGNNGEQRTIPLNKKTLEIIEERSRVRIIRNDYVFLNRCGGKVNSSSLGAYFRRSLEKAEITNFRFHDLMHCFATRSAQSGIDIYKVLKSIRHKDIKMTQRCAHHCPESLRVGVEVLVSVMLY